MPEGSGRMFSKVLSGLLVLVVLIMSVVQANASILSVAQFAGHPTAITHHNGTDIAAPPHSHDHSGSPCQDRDGTDGLPCCFAGSCSMLAGWLH